MAEASTSSRQDTSAAADARIALSRLRPALEHLHDDGLDTGASAADPDAFARQAERVHWVRLLANTCATLGKATPQPETPGPLTRLADAAAVAAVLHAEVQTNGQRWAIVAGLAQAATHLVAPAGGGEQHSPDVDRALIIAEASSGVLFQFASLDPPTAVDYAALRRPVPDPSPEVHSASDVVREASAALVHATRPGTGPHSIADLLAISTAAATVCRYVQKLHLAVGDDQIATQASEAIRAWTEVRDQLAPFNDGSRRSQIDRPPPVVHASSLHRFFQMQLLAPPGVPACGPGADGVALVVDRLATVADHLVLAFSDGVASGRLMAHAVDLPLRESRVRPFLEGHRTSGLVTANADDTAEVRAAFVRSRAAMVAVAGGISRTPSGVADRDLCHTSSRSTLVELPVPAPARGRLPELRESRR